MFFPSCCCLHAKPNFYKEMKENSFPLLNWAKILLMKGSEGL